MGKSAVIRLKPLVISLLIPLVAGGLSGILTSGSMQLYQSIKKPPLSPPGWVFPVVWTVLYLCMGIAAYLISASESVYKGRALVLYGAQLVVNVLWPVFYFTLEWRLFSFAWLVLLIVLVLATTFYFFRISKTAGYLMLPYILWLLFAGYLNLATWLLNR
ncbi:TspO/MBR family protein [Acetanaerobacterium elongatum]|uniref:TspO and MBR related proteins n=1 Tax=Acetanaerobacterium elongatum TaxID=258515 RepID=A0A1G9V1G6_9FIRM|nr:TspO/MBR family protein [Acetanaerobacterium elongatum]SDM66131.1 TspO and MBR related proteins [Acetanaerobacterium elongatum]